MHTVRVIPCLDVKDGRVVKGVNFVNLVDAGDPVEAAAAYDKAGADELTFLDITASSDARETCLDMVRRVAERVFIPFTVGGGIRTIEDIRSLLLAGADKVSLNTAAVVNPDLQECSAESRLHLVQNIGHAALNSVLFANGIRIKSNGNVRFTRPPKARRK